MYECEKCGKKYKLLRTYNWHKCVKEGLISVKSEEIKVFDLGEFPVEIMWNIIDYIGVKELWKCYEGGIFFGAGYEEYWRGRFNQECQNEMKRKIKCKNWGLSYILYKKGVCFCCGENKTRENVFFGFRCCFKCLKSKSQLKVITKTRAKGEYKLKDKDLEGLTVMLADNPHYKCATKMSLYLESDVKILSESK